MVSLLLLFGKLLEAARLIKEPFTTFWKLSFWVIMSSNYFNFLYYFDGIIVAFYSPNELS